MIDDLFRGPSKFLEYNPEPIEEKHYFNPSIQDMLSDPTCMIQHMHKNSFYQDAPDEDTPDSWNDDVQIQFDSFDYHPSSPDKKGVDKKPVAKQNEEVKKSDEAEGDDDEHREEEKRDVEEDA